MDDDRDLILADLRRALAKIPPAPAAPEAFGRDAYDGAGLAELRAKLELCGCELHEIASLAELPAAAAEALRAAGLPPVLAVAPAALRELDWASQEIRIQQDWDESLKAALTEVDGAIAETGQLIATGASDPQDFSLLADTHLALLRKEKVHPSLDHLDAALGASPAGVAALIAGPSRTADIEQTLVLGAHGPRRVVVFLC
ncbi:MAG: LUD domain-containing protein [Betaproteobacteria bacterium AqS2]|uniref:LUD domain-containing protein n=1 Tax=Candidatus Amphirhobacter heronislandensis TaxID=1732024 RepID=A0A930UHP9_9GAMM|nr:LUD domain-containing protein [Betaproteobacteria bacterium AqS2]